MWLQYTPVSSRSDLARLPAWQDGAKLYASGITQQQVLMFLTYTKTRQHAFENLKTPGTSVKVRLALSTSLNAPPRVSNMLCGCYVFFSGH